MKGICLKVKVKVQLEFKLAYDYPAVQCFNHYTTRTPISPHNRVHDFMVLSKYLRLIIIIYLNTLI